jgi:hypothetical protein
MWETRVMPGDVIVNRIPDQEADLKLGYKLGLGRVVKSGIDDVEVGSFMIFELQNAKEWFFPQGLELDFEPSPLGVFQLREGDLRIQIKKKSEATAKDLARGTTIRRKFRDE